MAVADLLEMTRDLPAAAVLDANASLVAKEVVSLSVMRERMWKRVQRILARGRVRNDGEYHLLIERLNEVGLGGLEEKQRESAGLLIAEYEKRNRQVPGADTDRHWRASRSGPGSRKRAGRHEKDLDRSQDPALAATGGMH